MNIQQNKNKHNPGKCYFKSMFSGNLVFFLIVLSLHVVLMILTSLDLQKHIIWNVVPLWHYEVF